MQKLFLSYSSQDRKTVDQLAHELSQQGISYWRDQDKLYAGQRWPKELGEAIAANDCVLLLWSKHAAASYYVEMEWCTAVALKKSILPCQLDDTPLPPSLASAHAADFRRGTDISSILKALLAPKPTTELAIETEIIKKLAAITGNGPLEVLQVARNTVFDQRQWTVHGDVHYHAGRDIHILAGITTQEDRNLSILLSKVKEFWVQGVLKSSLYDVATLEVCKTVWPGAVDHPWHTLVEVPGQGTRPLPRDKSLVDLFHETGRSLLILGDPGSGKTIALLQMAEHLIVHAETAPLQPIPVIFNLSTWKKDVKTFADWLGQELGSKYHVSRRMGRAWLKANRLFLLLDGLDEVKLEHRASCVDAINQYVAEWGTPGIVVCSRYKEYTALSRRLSFNAAVRLDPLTEEQVKDYLTEAGPRLRTVRQLIETDESLRVLSRSPLVLAIMTLTYKDVQLEKMDFTDGVAIEERRSQLMDAYIHRMFERKGQVGHSYSRNDVKAYLSWLAKRMIKASQAVFLIEALQPGWLTARRDQWMYWIGSRAVGLGVINCFVAVLSYIAFPSHKGAMVNALVTFITIISGVLMGGCVGMVSFIKTGCHSDSQRGESNFYAVLMHTLLSAVACGVVAAVIQTFYDVRDMYDYGEGLLLGLPELYPKSEQVMNSGITGAIFGFAFGLRDARRCQSDDIRTTESVAWSWSKARKGYSIGLLLGIALGGAIAGSYFVADKQFDLSIWLIGWLGTLGTVLLIVWQGSVAETNAVKHTFSLDFKISEKFFGYFLIVQVCMIAMAIILGRQYALYLPLQVSFFILTMAQYFGLFAALWHGWELKNVETKSVPNQGILLSVKNSLIITLIYFIFSLIMFGSLAIYMKATGQISAIHPLFFWGCLYLGILIGTWYALDVFQHYTLRFIMYTRGYAPLPYAKFLDHGTSLIFLQKVGGGYIFIHRLVMEHFASMKEVSPQQLPPSAAAEPVQERATS